MSVKAKNITGFLVNKKETRFVDQKLLMANGSGVIQVTNENTVYDKGAESFNQAIDLHAEREITLDREKLAIMYLKHLYPEETIEELTEQWGRRTDWGYVKRDGLEFADAIISKLDVLLICPADKERISISN